MTLQKGSHSHEILQFLFGQMDGAARSKDICKVDPWAFGAKTNKGPMGTLQENGFVLRIERGLYQITVAGMKELNELNA